MLIRLLLAALLSAASFSAQSATPVLSSKIRLSGPVTLYVSPSGNDQGPGTTTSPFGTPTQAYDYLATNYDALGQLVTVLLSDSQAYGRFVADGPITGVNDPNKLQFVGNLTHPENVYLDGGGNVTAISAGNGARFTFSGMTLDRAASCLDSFGAGTYVYVGAGVVFGNCPTFHINASVYGTVGGTVGYTIAGDAEFHHSVSVNGAQDFEFPAGTVINIVGTRTFISFAWVRFSATLDHKRATYSGGTINGRKFDIRMNGTAHTQAVDPLDYFPGSTAGTLYSGGQID